MGSLAAMFTPALTMLMGHCVYPWHTPPAMWSTIYLCCSNVLLLRIPHVPINASRFLVETQIDPLRRATVIYAIFLAVFGFTHPGHDMPPLNVLGKGIWQATVASWLALLILADAWSPIFGDTIWNFSKPWCKSSREFESALCNSIYPEST
jgi:hypothetical protein